jgi:hypothetical protein
LQFRKAGSKKAGEMVEKMLADWQGEYAQGCVPLMPCKMMGREQSRISSQINDPRGLTPISVNHHLPFQTGSRGLYKDGAIAILGIFFNFPLFGNSFSSEPMQAMTVIIVTVACRQCVLGANVPTVLEASLRRDFLTLDAIIHVIV